jgi:hypothetical protein
VAGCCEHCNVLILKGCYERTLRGQRRAVVNTVMFKYYREAR